MAQKSRKSRFANGLAALTFVFASAVGLDIALDHLDTKDDAPVLTEQELRELRYRNAIDENSMIMVSENLAAMGRDGLSDIDMQYVKDAVLLRAALDGDYTAIETSLKFGADALVQTLDSESLAEVAVGAHGLPAFRELRQIAKKYSNINFGLLVQNEKLMSKLLASYDHGRDKGQLLSLLKEAARYGVKLDEIGESYTGVPVNIPEIAARENLSEILVFLQDEGAFKDTIGQYWNYNLYADYMVDSNAPIMAINPEDFVDGDFYKYPKLSMGWDAPEENNVEPTLFIFENPTVGTEEKRIDHIKKVAYAANGVSRRLGGKDWFGDYVSPLPMISARISGAPIIGDYSLARSPVAILEAAKDDYVIVTESVSVVPTERSSYMEMYRDNIVYPKNSNFTVLDVGQNHVFYTPAGNNFPEHCIEVDGKDFCLQDKGYTRHSKGAVRVGAVFVGQNDDDEIRNYVADYSGQNPTFCAYLPFHHQKALSGTSFATPAAAAVEQKLADIFARSASFPEGVVHDDIVFALMATADNSTLYDASDDKRVGTFKNSAGLDLSDRCGAGIIQPDKAMDLLSDMVDWTKEFAAVEPTQPKFNKSRIDLSTVQQVDGAYHYTVTMQDTGTLMNLRAGIYFDGPQKGAAEIKIGDMDPVILDLSAVGITSEFRFVGHKVSAGDEITIITTKPLGESVMGASRPFLDVKLVQPSSSINMALAKMK